MYNPIDLNHIFNDDDIVGEWIRDGEEPMLSSDNVDWFDQDLLFKEGREPAREDSGGTSYRVSRRASSIAQGRDIGSSRKGKAHRIIYSGSSSDDGDDRVNSGGSNIDGAVKIVNTLMETMEQVVALEQVVLLMMVMLIKLIMACCGYKEMKIIMPHKIQIMDID